MVNSKKMQMFVTVVVSSNDLMYMCQNRNYQIFQIHN